MDSLRERVATFSERRERTILGFDIEECIKRKIPPKKVVSNLPEFSHKITGGDGSSRLETPSFYVQRYRDTDAYGKNLTYTYYYNYANGRASIYRDGAWDLWVLA